MKRGFNTRGQVTIFILIGIVIVALGILIYMFYSEIKESVEIEAKNPSAFMQSCLEEQIGEGVEKLGISGGSLDPEHYFLYQDEKIEYLCYTEEYYQTCVMQQPMLKKHVESEIKDYIEKDFENCLDSLKESYEKKNYRVNMKKEDFEVELLPKRIVVFSNSSLTLSKDGSQEYDSLRVVVNNNLYELISVSNSILDWEAKYGDSETTIYMDYYRDLKVEKLKQSDGTTIYILTDRNNRNKFQFASRSVAWPPGYGTGDVI
ncbi:MAG: hypothetical protein ABH811_00030 [archaeon]